MGRLCFSVFWGFALRDFERLTELGRFLRATSLDELPELFNVIQRGHEPCGAPAQARRHEVKPGLTPVGRR